MTDVHIDIETRSPHDLRDVGAARYFEDFDILIVRWAVGDGEVQRWWPQHNPEMPAELAAMFADPGVLLTAQNANFEFSAFNAKGYVTPIERWRCTQVMALALALPHHLAGLTETLKLGDDGKMKEGSRLIQKFSKPKKVHASGRVEYRDWTTDPKDFELFDLYCEHDVRAERKAHRIMSRYDIPGWVWEQWFCNMRMNERGLPLDMGLVQHAMRFDDAVKVALLDEASRLTGLDNPNSGSQLLPWLRERGYEPDDLTKASVAAALDVVQNADAHRVLEIRQQTSRTSSAKFAKASRMACKDGRVRGVFQFLGASRTGRDAGRGIQPQNFPGPSIPNHGDAVNLLRTGQFDAIRALWDDPTEVVKSCTRAMFRAPEGKLLRVADLSAIENVVVGWIAREPVILDLHRKKRDPYKVFALDAFPGTTYETVTKEQRKFSKPPVLAAAFRIGGGRLIRGVRTGLWAYAAGMGIEMEREEAHRLVKIWRETHPAVVKLWTDLEWAFREAMAEGTAEVGALRFDYKKPFVRIRLPSGRFLHYCKPSLRMVVAPWWDEEDHEPGTEPEMIEAITYLGVHKQWCRITTHGGKLVENVAQAAARDILYDGLVRAEKAGFEVLGSVHDEILAMSPEGSDLDHDALGALMSKPPSWAPDIPLRAAGYSSKFFTKD